MELGFRGTCARPARQPRKLASQHVLAFLLGKRRYAVALHALHDIGRKPALKRVNLPVVNLPHGVADLIEKPAIMCDREKRTLGCTPARFQVFRKPSDGLYVEMIGRLVKHENIPVADENSRKINATALTTGKRFHLRLPVHIIKKPLQNRADLRVGCPNIFGSNADDIALHTGRTIKRVSLSEKANTGSARRYNTTVIRLDLPVQQP